MRHLCQRVDELTGVVLGAARDELAAMRVGISDTNQNERMDPNTPDLLEQVVIEPTRRCSHRRQEGAFGTGRPHEGFGFSCERVHSSGVVSPQAASNYRRAP